MPYGITYKELNLLCERLAGKLNISDEDVKIVFKEIIREDVARIAKNEIVKEGNNGS